MVVIVPRIPRRYDQLLRAGNIGRYMEPYKAKVVAELRPSVAFLGGGAEAHLYVPA